MEDILSNYSRTPKIYLRLPSGGKFYDVDPTQKAGTGELPVLSMTARDELLMKTPDALMNGESVASCIRNCVPLIEDPWAIPLIDLDAILIAIRIATYGETMKVSPTVRWQEGDKEESEQIEVDVNLVQVLDELQSKTWQEEFKFKDLTIHTHPLKFSDQNIFEQKTYETSRFLKQLNDPEIVEKAGLENYKNQMTDMFTGLSDINLSIVAKQIKSITTPAGEVEDRPEKILQWMNNLSTQDYGIIRDFVEKQKTNFDLPLRKVSVPQDLVSKGAVPEIEFPLVFNQSSFFV